jgi:outer membrane protein insertion porin family
MRSIIKRIFAISCFLFVANVSFASAGFTVRNIRVQGLQNLAPSTVLNYLPIHAGQRFDYAKSDQILQSLYSTGFFYSIGLGRSGNTLIVNVKERPMITLVNIIGNKAIEDRKIAPVLKKIGVSTGNTYDPMKLKLFDQSLEQQYAIMGYAATSVHSTVKRYSHNRVEIDIHVDEGKIVKVNSINFIGNHAFSARKLRDQMALTTPGIMTIFNHKDRYSDYKLNKDLQTLSNFYMNHGYVRFRIDSHKAVYTPNHKRVNIYITLTEGPVYHISGLKIIGQTKGMLDKLYKVATFKAGDVFSRQQIINTQKNINTVLADKAYAFATIAVQPNINNLKHTVFITYNVVAGQKVYVRQIHFTGNTTTDQKVLRERMLQMEAAPYSKTKVDLSKRQLLMLPYIPKVDVSTQPVPGTNNQVDLDYTVQERAAGKATINGGWSSAYGFLYGASISQPNFLGTGKSVSIGFTNSQVTQNYYFSYVNPYYTWYGVSRAFSVSVIRNKFTKEFNFTPYNMDSYGADLTYTFPLSIYNALSVDIGFHDMVINNVAGTYVAPSVLAFLRPTADKATDIEKAQRALAYGSQTIGQTPEDIARNYGLVKTNFGWTYNSEDRYLMPTRGIVNQAGLEVGVSAFGQSLAYANISDSFSAYVPVTHGFILNFIGNVAYGRSLDHNGLYPFFMNYYAGGIGTVPGYQSNSLGPKYAPGTAFGGSALGGNLLTTGGIHLILPSFLGNTFRAALTFDAGNVFQSPVYGPDTLSGRVLTRVCNPLGSNQHCRMVLPGSAIIQDDPFALKNMRMSAGILVTWVAPMLGPINLSFAVPLNKKKGDLVEEFQFGMGATF